MKKNLRGVAALWVALLLGCSIQVNQPVVTTTATSIPTREDAILSTASATGSERPVTWSALNLTGRLVYSRVSSSDDVSALSVETLDLVTGMIRKVFTVPGDGWIHYSAVSPDGKQLIISYVPSSDTNPSRNEALYRLPLDGSAPPELWVTPPSDADQYIQVEWSPDGKYLYYVHNNYSTQPADQIFPNYRIFRLTYPDGEPEQIAEHAFWPRISPDSSRLVYVSVDPVTGTNELVLANADGTDAHVIESSTSRGPSIKDAPFFTSDGQSILFSAPSPTQSYQPNWLDRLTGVQVAKAHNLPSDWWSVPVTGGTPIRLTQIQSTNLFARMSPDQKHVISFSLDGLFVMERDGSNLTAIIPDSGGSTVDWIP